MNTKYNLCVLFVSLAQILAACAGAVSTPDPATVFQNHYEAFNERKLDEAMSFVADNAVFNYPDGRYVGTAEIRAMYQSGISDGVTVEVNITSDTNGRIVSAYKVFVGGGLVTTGTGLTIIQDGKIIFDGTETTWKAECSQNAWQRFCGEAPVASALNPTATPAPTDPAAMMQSFYKALDDGDLEAAMALLAEDVKFSGVPYLTGKEAVRRYLQTTIDDEGWRQEFSDLKVEGDKVTYTWTVYNPNGYFSARGVETLQIKDGLIILIETIPQ